MTYSGTQKNLWVNREIQEQQTYLETVYQQDAERQYRNRCCCHISPHRGSSTERANMYYEKVKELRNSNLSISIQ